MKKRVDFSASASPEDFTATASTQGSTLSAPPSASPSAQRPRLQTGASLLNRIYECRCGHLLRQESVHASWLPWDDGRLQCGRCPKVLEVGSPRWFCSECNKDHCRACAEASGQVQSVQDFFGASNPIALAVAQVSTTVDDFLVTGGSAPATLAWPAHRRGSRSEGPSRRFSVGSVDSMASHDAPRVSRRYSSRQERRLSRREDQRAHSQLSAVPFLGIRPLFQVQKDTLARIERLIRHGDAPGARHAVARARQLNVDEEDLEASIAALRLLEAEDNLLGFPDGFPGG